MNQIKQYKELEIYFNHVDHIDTKTIVGDTCLRNFIAGMFSYQPRWVLLLYQIINILVKIIGLVKHENPEILSPVTPENITFKPGESVSLFIVRNAKENIYWVSETPKDKHLKAYFGVVTEKINDSLTRFHVFTSVKYIHWTGPVYFNLIRPFHHLVVARMMKAGIKQ